MNPNRIALSCLVLALCAAPARAQSPAPQPDAPPAVNEAGDDIAALLFADALGPPPGPEDGMLAANAPGAGPGTGMRDRGMGSGGGAGGMAPWMRGARRGALAARMRGLDLSKEQRERLADIRDAQQRRAVQMGADLRIAQLDLRKAMRAERPDRAAIDTQVERAAQLRGELMKSRVHAMLEAQGVLTPAQREKLRQPPARGMRDEGTAPARPRQQNRR